MLGKKKKSGSRKTTDKRLVTRKLRNPWPLIHHSHYLGRKIGSSETGKEASPCDPFKLLWTLGMFAESLVNQFKLGFQFSVP